MRQRLIVTVGDGATEPIDAVVGQLSDAGLEVESVLSSIGVITGSAVDTQLEAIRSVPGVVVEADKDVVIPPPDAPVT